MLWRNCWINDIADPLNHWSGSQTPGSILHSRCGTCNCAASTEGELHMSRKEIDEFGSEVRVLVLYSKYSQHSYDAILTRLMGVQANNLYCGKDDKHSLKLSHSCRALVVYWKRLLSLGSRCFEDAFYKILFFSFFFFCLEIV